MNDPDPKDHSRVLFASTNACDLADLTLSEAKLVDDLSEFGTRELRPFERSMIDRMKQRWDRLRIERRR